MTSRYRQDVQQRSKYIYYYICADQHTTFLRVIDHLIISLLFMIMNIRIDFFFTFFAYTFLFKFGENYHPIVKVHQTID